MERRVFVAKALLASAQSAEVIHSLGHSLAVQVHDNAASLKPQETTVSRDDDV